MKTLLVASVLSACVLTASSAFAWGNDCEYTRDIKREVSLVKSMQLNVVAGAGELDIKGDDDRDVVLIEAKLCAEDESQLADMDVASKLKGDVLHLKTEFAKSKFWGSGSDGAYIDLTVHVPAGARLDVADSSGEARVAGVESLKMVDSSGELAIEDISGDVRVKDSSGALNIKHVDGSVWVTDSSGTIKVRDVSGDFTVEVDSSGSIEAEEVGGNVLVRTDSSGAIDVSDIGGNFSVGNDSSGGIYHKNVAGEVSLPN